MSDGKKYFCFCSSNCKYETMTKEQILAAIAQAAETGLVFDAESAFITKVKESNAGGFVTFWVGTTAQYNALEEHDPNCIYIKTDDTEKADLAAAFRSIQENVDAVAKVAAGKVPIGLFTRRIGVNKNEDSQTFWQQIEAIYAGMEVQSIEYVCGNVVYDYKETDANEPAGGVWAVEIYKSTDKYGYVSARKYNNGAFGDTAYFVRNLINGVWSDTYYPQGEINTAINKLGIESTEFAGCFYRTVNGAQEWINPPMKQDVEYATTERYNGKTVYTKRIQIYELPSVGGSSAAAVIDTRKVDVIDCRGHLYSLTATDAGTKYPFPVFAWSGGTTAQVNAWLSTTKYDSKTQVHVHVTSDRSAYWAEIFVKYTK